ncbi:hypothetical protein D3C76_1766740 [compost metagenome]
MKFQPQQGTVGAGEIYQPILAGGIGNVTGHTHGNGIEEMLVDFVRQPCLCLCSTQENRAGGIVSGQITGKHTFIGKL